MTAAVGPAVELSAVSLIRDGAAIVREVDLAVEYGRVLALVGPNGAGKSSLLAIMARDVAPTRGDVLLDGRPLAGFRAGELSRRRSVLLQSNEVAFGFTVADVVEMGRAPWPRGDDEPAVIASALRRADVEHLVARRFATLSGGERARTSLARVLAQNTDVVLLDEPTAALDIGHQESVLRIARELAGEGRAVVVVLHDLSLAAAYADEVAMMAEGGLVARGTPHETLTAARVEAVYGTPVRVLEDPDTGRPIVIPRRSL